MESTKICKVFIEHLFSSWAQDFVHETDLLKVRVLVEVLIVKLVHVSCIVCFRHDALFIQHRDDTKRLKIFTVRLLWFSAAKQRTKIVFSKGSPFNNDVRLFEKALDLACRVYRVKDSEASWSLFE